QLVNHGHFTVDGKKADIPSMSIKLGSVIELKEKSQKNVQITEALESKAAAAWLTRKDFTVKYDRLPERNEVHTEIKDALIVEFYAK
ncbi:30S ribosomal protein S4, partial [Mycoplasmopsis pullorum]